MKRFSISMICGILVLTFYLAAIYKADIYPAIKNGRYVFNQKITLTFDTPNGRVTASNVGQSTWQFSPKQLWKPKSGMRTLYDGEALVADLGDGNVVFLTVRAAPFVGQRIVEYNNWEIVSPDDWEASIRYIWNSRGEVWDIPFEILTNLVTFGSIADPTTHRYLEPADLREVFGDGYSLASATFELTDEPKTEGVAEKALQPWLILNRAGELPYSFTTDGEKDLSLTYFFRGETAQQIFEGHP